MMFKQNLSPEQFFDYLTYKHNSLFIEWTGRDGKRYYSPLGRTGVWHDGAPITVEAKWWPFEFDDSTLKEGESHD